MQTQTEIVRAVDLRRSVFARDFVHKCRPVLIRQAPELMEVSARWSLDYLIVKHPSNVVTVRRYPLGDRSRFAQDVRMEFGRFVDLIRGSTDERRRYFLSDVLLADTFPNTASELTTPPILAGSKILRVALFAGVDTFTHAHYHTTPLEALLTQVSGRKSVVLYSPTQWKSLLPFPWYSMRFNFSRISPDYWNGDALARPAGGHECTLEPGDMLFIPQGWFHVATGLSENVSVSYFFKGRLRDAHARILFRDVASVLQKTLFVLPIAKITRNPRILRLLLRAAVFLGIIPPSDLKVWWNCLRPGPRRAK